MKHGKKYIESQKLIDTATQYDPDQACALALKTGKAKFDETVEVSIRLGVDTRKSDQTVRGAVDDFEKVVSQDEDQNDSDDEPKE